MFPTTSQILNNYLIHLAGVFVMLLVGAVILYRLVKSRNAAREEEGTVGKKTFGVLALLILVVAALFVARPMVNAFRYRFDPQQIAEIRMTRLGDETRPGLETPKQVVITDSALIAKGFQSLFAATGYSLDHEHFLPDGYRIEIKPAGSSDYSPMHLIAYRQSRKSTSGAVPVNIVAVNSSTNAASMDFSSPAFHSWLRKNVDPLFAPPPSPELVR